MSLARKALLLPLFLLALPKLALAMCPLCSAAVGGAAIVAGYYGVDFSIIGLFIGAFGLSTGIWAANWIKTQHIPHQKKIIVAASLVLTIIPMIPIVPDAFYLPLHILDFTKVLWLNKILVGSILGVLISYGAFAVHNKIKQTMGKVLFPYQGVVLPVIALSIASLAIYLIL